MTSRRTWWRNCAQQVDQEILDIDSLEDRIYPLTKDISRIRELISTLELCHHKAEIWVSNIIAAIGSGQTTKGLGTRATGEPHAAEHLWQDICDALSGWCAGAPASAFENLLDSAPASRLLGNLGPRSRMKEWQVQRIIERIQSFIRWPRTANDIVTNYRWMLESGSPYESVHITKCPEYFAEHEAFWSATVGSIVHNKIGGIKEKLSLALAIDLLMPCHWNFVENLEIVLAAIGGNLEPENSFLVCGLHVKHTPIHMKMKMISDTLQLFSGTSTAGKNTDQNILRQLDEPTDVKRWLALSLDKTIRLQLEM